MNPQRLAERRFTRFIELLDGGVMNCKASEICDMQAKNLERKKGFRLQHGSNGFFVRYAQLRKGLHLII